MKDLIYLNNGSTSYPKRDEVYPFLPVSAFEQVTPPLAQLCS